MTFFPLPNHPCIEAFVNITDPALTLGGVMIAKVEDGGLAVLYPGRIERGEMTHLFPRNPKKIEAAILEAYGQFKEGVTA